MSVAADPAEEAMRADEAADHAKAAQRGARVLRITNDVVDKLHANGYPVPPDDLRVEVFHVIAGALYGNAAIDIPTLRKS